MAGRVLDSSGCRGSNGLGIEAVQEVGDGGTCIWKGKRAKEGIFKGGGYWMCLNALRGVEKESLKTQERDEHNSDTRSTRREGGWEPGHNWRL